MTQRKLLYSASAFILALQICDAPQSLAMEPQAPDASRVVAKKVPSVKKEEPKKAEPKKAEVPKRVAPGSHANGVTLSPAPTGTRKTSDASPMDPVLATALARRASAADQRPEPRKEGKEDGAAKARVAEKRKGQGTLALEKAKAAMRKGGGVDLTGDYPVGDRPDLSTLSGQIQSLDADPTNGRGFAFAKFAQARGCDGMLFGSEGSVLHHVAPTEVGGAHIRELHEMTQKLQRGGQTFAYADMLRRQPHLITQYRKLPGWAEFFRQNPEILALDPATATVSGTGPSASHSGTNGSVSHAVVPVVASPMGASQSNGVVVAPVPAPAKKPDGKTAV